MNRKVILKNAISESVLFFSELLEKEREARNMTQKEWAERLNISLSSYHRIINGTSTSVPIDMIINAHRLTGMWLYQMIGESTDHTDCLDKYMLLDEADQEIVRSLVYSLWKRSGK